MYKDRKKEKPKLIPLHFVKLNPTQQHNNEGGSRKIFNLTFSPFLLRVSLLFTSSLSVTHPNGKCPPRVRLNCVFSYYHPCLMVQPPTTPLNVTSKILSYGCRFNLLVFQRCATFSAAYLFLPLSGFFTRQLTLFPHRFSWYVLGFFINHSFSYSR